MNEDKRWSNYLKMRETPPCSKHRNVRLSYIAFHFDASKRDAKGEKQKKCPSCGLWIWESLYKNPD